MSNANLQMKDLTCRQISLGPKESFNDTPETKECVIHLISGKGLLIIENNDGDDWKYPLNSYDTVWIPPETRYSLINDGIGNLSITVYEYSA